MTGSVGIAEPTDEPPRGPGGSIPTVIHSIQLEAESPLAIIEAVKGGLSYERLAALQTTLELSTDELADAIGTSPRSLARRKESGTLKPEESDRLVQLGILFDEAVGLFEEDIDAARAWFKRSNRALGGRPPLEVSSTFVGAREVAKLIGRLEHGVFA